MENTYRRLQLLRGTVDFSEQYAYPNIWSGEYYGTQEASFEGLHDYRLQLRTQPLDSLGRFGTVVESNAPYRLDDESAPVLDAHVARYYMGQVQAIATTASAIQRYIAVEHQPVYVGCIVPLQAWSFGEGPLLTNPDQWDEGVVALPNDADRVVTLYDWDGSGHAVLIVGWDFATPRPGLDGYGNRVWTQPETEFFLARNSWGRSNHATYIDEYGATQDASGYVWLSRRYVETYCTAVSAAAPTDEQLSCSCQAENTLIRPDICQRVRATHPNPRCAEISSTPTSDSDAGIADASGRSK